MKNSRLEKLNLLGICLVGLAFAIQGCSNKALNNKIDRAVAQDNSINSRTDLRQAAIQVVRNSPGLSENQRTKLESLQKTTGMLHDNLRAESYKLRLVLIKSLVSEQYDQREVNLLEQRIKEVENKHLVVTFNAIQEAKSILGHEIKPDHRNLMENYFERHEGLE
jgi:hypothetical protein